MCVRERACECVSECERSGRRQRLAELTRSQVPKPTASAAFGPSGDGHTGPRPAGSAPWTGEVELEGEGSRECFRAWLEWGARG